MMSRRKKRPAEMTVGFTTAHRLGSLEGPWAWSLERRPGLKSISSSDPCCATAQRVPVSVFRSRISSLHSRHRVDWGPHSCHGRMGALVNAWSTRFASRDTKPITVREFLTVGAARREDLMASAAYLRNTLWWTQKENLRSSRPGRRN